MKHPTVFISYSWDNLSHKEWVILLANELRKNGIDATIDEFITQKGTVNLNRMMVENISKNDYIIVVLTDKYTKKANEFKGGVGYETTLLINYMADNIDRIIPIIRFNGDKSNVVPFYLKGASYIDFTDDLDFETKLEELKYRILKVNRYEMEPLGQIPNINPRKVSRDTFNRSINFSEDLIPDFKEITDRDKNKFIHESYSEILKHLTDLANQTKEKNNNFDFEVETVTSRKSIIRFYVNDMEKRSVKIWLDRKFSQQESILLSYDVYGVDNDSSCNEMIMIDIGENKKMKLEMPMNMFANNKKMDSKDVAIEIWKQYIK